MNRRLFALISTLLALTGCALANSGPAGAPATAIAPGLPAATRAPSGPYNILFDASHAETAGNADWVISASQPDPLRENARPRAESDWTGALSAWGVALQRTGRYRLMTLPRGGRISLDDGANPLDLGQFDVFVVPEPNRRFADDEKRAIMTFVQRGGGLFMIADHARSNRDNDGYDAPQIWNDLMRDNPVAAGDPFGFSFDMLTISRDNPRGIPRAAAADPIIHGPFGDVAGSIIRDGTTATIRPERNPAVRGLIYRSRADTAGTTGVFFLSSAFGQGRVAAWGDSSPIDDGTGAPGEQLFDGWDDAGGSNAILALNATEWLAGGTAALAATPAPAPPTAVAPDGRDLVQNGDFERGAAGWRATSNNRRAPISRTRVHSGVQAADLCGFDNCTASLAQTIEIPAGVSATLSFYTSIATQETGRAFDFLTVALNAPGSTPRAIVRLSNADAADVWRLTTADLSDYAGSSVELVFTATTGRLKPTEFFVDDVSITIR